MNNCRSIFLRVCFLGMAALILAACTTTRPIPIAPSKPMVHALESQREQAQDGAAASTAPRSKVVAVCYNSAVNNDTEIEAEALLSCPDGRLTLREDDQFWTRCPLLQPQRANFICVPVEKPDFSMPVQ